ncbi:MAG: hypothetical protein ACRYF8_15605 [Janthinobacterium lividum]
MGPSLFMGCRVWAEYYHLNGVASNDSVERPSGVFPAKAGPTGCAV